ncbi:MAG: DUF2064 domain-containing protein [Planctomycetes bacterium]|nr:DUF2064 domain-containing protein [Planctomycetota bacterium]
MKRWAEALALFVKTPGVSPVKTRLAAGLGRERAEEFFRLSLAAVEATARRAADVNGIRPHWAVAEEMALEDPRWQRFPRLYQGTGNLGDRLGRVFIDLGRRHETVVATGGDSPQISPDIIREAFSILRLDSGLTAHVLGRCHDGGFYLVGTNRHLPLDTWCDVPYGTGDAADRLAENLVKHGEIVELPALTDVDQAENLVILKDELNAVPNPSPEQLAILKWITELVCRPK